jgi:23S rRNA (cytidine1920-2'-O)/16S rRNA (cytidine1409-2'-O)-methyltransferase
VRKQRLDQRLVEEGLAPSRQRAQGLVLAGLVFVDGAKAAKPGQAVAPEAALEVAGPEHPYASRGGVKLAGALDALGLDPAGWRCLDVGASTGGFTDCLLQRGAAAVTALDVGYGQLAWKLRQDPRVEVIERTNARELGPDTAPGPFDLITADLSFISLTLVCPALAPRLAPGGMLLVMIKPQFEAGRERVGPGGVVRDPQARREAVDKVREHLAGLGLEPAGEAPSPLPGPKGNLEHFVLAVRPAEG